jgi:hypothetical protein
MSRFYPALIYGGVGFFSLIPLEEKIRALLGWGTKMIFCFFGVLKFSSFCFFRFGCLFVFFASPAYLFFKKGLFFMAL